MPGEIRKHELARGGDLCGKTSKCLGDELT